MDGDAALAERTVAVENVLFLEIDAAPDVFSSRLGRVRTAAVVRTATTACIIEDLNGLAGLTSGSPVAKDHIAEPQLKRFGWDSTE
jgi:hypothetical protein